MGCPSGLGILMVKVINSLQFTGGKHDCIYPGQALYGTLKYEELGVWEEQG